MNILPCHWKLTSETWCSNTCSDRLLVLEVLVNPANLVGGVTGGVTMPKPENDLFMPRRGGDMGKGGVLMVGNIFSRLSCISVRSMRVISMLFFIGGEFGGESGMS